MYVSFIERLIYIEYGRNQAKGDAEAELAVMNQLGIVDAILTRDSDVFPLGAQCVLKVAP